MDVKLHSSSSSSSSLLTDNIAFHGNIVYIINIEITNFKHFI